MGANIGSPIQDVYQVKVDSANIAIQSGDVEQVTLKTYTVQGGTMGPNGVIRIKATGRSVGNNGNKTYRLKFGGIEIAVLTVTPAIEDKFWTLFAACHNHGAEDSQHWSVFWGNDTTIDLNQTEIITAENTADLQVLVLTAQLTNAADECRITDWTIEINPAG